MALNWGCVSQQHVTRACEMILADPVKYGAHARSIFIKLSGQRVPAKAAMRLAYCLASDLPLNTDIKFSSGEGIAKLLKRLGFEVEVTSNTRSPA